MNHDESCEQKRADWPQFKEWTDPVTGETKPAGPYPCHCLAREQGRLRALETGDVVAVLSASGEVAYYGEVATLPTGDAALRDVGKIGVWNPETDEVHYVAAANGEGLRVATEAESDAYIDRWVDSE